MKSMMQRDPAAVRKNSCRRCMLQDYDVMFVNLVEPASAAKCTDRTCQRCRHTSHLYLTGRLDEKDLKISKTSGM